MQKYCFTQDDCSYFKLILFSAPSGIYCIFCDFTQSLRCALRRVWLPRQYLICHSYAKQHVYFKYWLKQVIICTPPEGGIRSLFTAKWLEHSVYATNRRSFTEPVTILATFLCLSNEKPEKKSEGRLNTEKHFRSFRSDFIRFSLVFVVPSFDNFLCWLVRVSAFPFIFSQTFGSTHQNKSITQIQRRVCMLCREVSFSCLVIWRKPTESIVVTLPSRPINCVVFIAHYALIHVTR